ncbi:MAG: DUF1080 domain-containing protein [Armatimonadota bacterium]|nr:DUF1080 domain-containing protein [Armatimonadota bacterium]MCX7777051.1 DUF1080 domain-containing protein [Armatimonadota bacterium]MDW8024881.1 DUF1080 domain-containing protein [Armatimonadota bacterium]
MKGEKSIRCAAIAVAICFAIAHAAVQPKHGAKGEEGFVPLFNGKDLSGWKVMGAQSWEVKDGVLICHGKGSGWLCTEREYENFVLRLEYKISKDGNSGIFIRTGLKGRQSRIGMEVQILDSYGRKPTTGTAGAIYGAVVPTKEASKPAGEWNEVEITCDGPKVTVILNGEKIIDVNMDEHPLLKDRLRKGYIGLQNHGSYVEFRNIRIKELPGK